MTNTEHQRWCSLLRYLVLFEGLQLAVAMINIAFVALVVVWNLNTMRQFIRGLTP